MLKLHHSHCNLETYATELKRVRLLPQITQNQMLPLFPLSATIVSLSLSFFFWAPCWQLLVTCVAWMSLVGWLGLQYHYTPKDYQINNSPPKLPNRVPKAIRERIRQSCAHTTYRDQLIPVTNRFGNHRAGITENSSKIVKFGSVIIFCVMVILKNKNIL